MTDINMLSGLNILVVGLGREGKALVRYLTKQNMAVTATDIRPKEDFEADELASLRESGATLVLEEHPISLLDKADILFVSPGIPLKTPFLEEARTRKIALSTETRLFCYLCPVPIMAITGSSGKTTTTTLLAKMLELDGRKVWVGGNIGQPLIELVGQIETGDVVVMELSSFQLEYFHARLNKEVKANSEQLAPLLDNWSPATSAILNITPNHLDRHPSMKRYVMAKRAIINYQDAQKRSLIMSLDNDMTRTIGGQFRAYTHWFSLEAQVPKGASLVNDEIVLCDDEGTLHTVVNKKEIKMLGSHNISNIMAACLMAREANVSLKAMREVATTFTGVENRLQLIRTDNNVRYYNDSISTSPERMAAALRSFTAPIILLAGGRDKQLPWEDAAHMIVYKTNDVILYGEAAELISHTISKVCQDIVNKDTTIHHCHNLEEAVKLAASIAQPDDVVLLSPGCTSFDAFRDFEERGNCFNELVLQL